MNVLTALQTPYIQIPLLLLVLWVFTAYMTRSFPTLTNKRICLLIAHPDDEAMFFGPSLLYLTRPELGNIVVILCLSTGDADGLGHIRVTELRKSAVLLGVRSAEHVVVVDDKALFPDSMTVKWDAKAIGNLLVKYFAPNVAKTAATEAPTAGVDVIVTFDRGGVSGHPNHVSLYHGARSFLETLMQRHRGWDCPTKLYTLRTTGMVRKYMSFLDSLVTVAWNIGSKKEKGEFPTPLMIVGLPGDVFRAQKAMVAAHKSQMRWFRWGWIGLSRYMVMNDLTKQKGF